MNFFKQTNHSKQITLEQGVMFDVIQRMRFYVLPVCACVRGREPESVCVGDLYSNGDTYI